MTHRRLQRGFTLIELLVSVAIVALLASVALPFAELTAQREKERELRMALRQIRTAIDAYKQASDEGRIVRSPDQSGYPPDLQALVDGVPDAKDPGNAKIYFLRRIPHDPFAEASSATWGLRSYDSPPQAPSAGRDVYDVFSLSPRIGINGMPYKEW